MKNILKKMAAAAAAGTDAAYAAYADDMASYGHTPTRDGFRDSLYNDSFQEHRQDMATSSELAGLVAMYGVERVYNALSWTNFIRPGFSGFSPENLSFLAKKCEEEIALLAEVELREKLGERGSLKDLARLFHADIKEWEHSVGGDSLNDPGYSRMCYRGKTIAGEMAIDLLRNSPEMRPADAMDAVREAAAKGRPGSMDDLAALFPDDISVTYDHHRDLRSGKEWSETIYHGKIFSIYGEKAVEILRSNPELTPVQAMEMAKNEVEKIRAEESARKEAEESAAKAARIAAREAEFAAEEARRSAMIAEREARREAESKARREADKRDYESRRMEEKKSMPEEKPDEDNFGAGAFDALAGLKF